MASIEASTHGSQQPTAPRGLASNTGPASASQCGTQQSWQPSKHHRCNIEAAARGAYRQRPRDGCCADRAGRLVRRGPCSHLLHGVRCTQLCGAAVSPHRERDWCAARPTLEGAGSGSFRGLPCASYGAPFGVRLEAGWCEGRSWPWPARHAHIRHSNEGASGRPCDAFDAGDGSSAGRRPGKTETVAIRAESCAGRALGQAVRPRSSHPNRQYRLALPRSSRNLRSRDSAGRVLT